MDTLEFTELTVDQLNSLVFYLGSAVIFLLGVIVTLCICSRQDIITGCSNAFLWYFLMPLLLITITYNSHSTIENIIRSYGLTLEDPNDFNPPYPHTYSSQQYQYSETMKDNREETKSDVLIPHTNYFKNLVDFAYGKDRPPKDPKECVTETIEEINENGDKVISARIKCV